MQEGRKEVSLLRLLSQFPALWFSPFPVWAVRSICSSGHDIMLHCDTTLNTTWSCHIAAEVYIWRGILQAWRCSEKDCSGLEHLSCLTVFYPLPEPVPPLTGPQTQAGGQLVEAHWDHQQRHEQHKGLKGEDTPCNNTLRLPLHLVITSKVSIQAAGMITFVCLQGF